MIKYTFLLLFNLISLLLLSYFSEDISITMDAPEEVTAGSTFTVSYTINKGTLQSFARFMQDLPIGVSAAFSPDKIQGADPSFKDQKVKLLWLKLPEAPTFTFSYTIYVDPTVTGTITIGGEFSYIIDNQRQSANVTPKTITVKAGDPTATTATPTPTPSSTTTSEPNIVPTTNITQAQSTDVTCFRKLTFSGDAQNSVIVTLQISTVGHQGAWNKFAKIQETLPTGYTATNIRNESAIFNFKEPDVKFLWMNLPPLEKFVISYKIIPPTGVDPKTVNIEGTFSFIENDKTEIVTIVNGDFQILETSGQQELAQQQATQTNSPTSSKNINQTKTEREPKTLAENTPKTTANTKKASSTSQSSKIPQPEQGVNFKVQIGAYKRNLNTAYFNNKLNIKDKVNKELHQGLNKYTVGSYNAYKDARDYRVEIWNSTPIKDAFVSAYNNGNRITVQEALMIAQQKWIK